MYKGYNLHLSEDFFKYFRYYYDEGLRNYENRKLSIKNRINSFRLKNGEIDGTAMQSNWFPIVSADIFLSHSHKDKDLAIAFSRYLKEVFGLNAFVDSCLWGNSTVLLRLLDDFFALHSKGRYDYNIRNLTTSHVHMMLQTALTQMIDATECVVFLNTPNSITPFDTINRTSSPWIYSELSSTLLMRKKSPQQHRRLKCLNENKTFSTSDVKIEYNISLDHLIEIGESDLLEWETRQNYSNALDVLYNLF